MQVGTNSEEMVIRAGFQVSRNSWNESGNSISGSKIHKGGFCCFGLRLGNTK